MIIFLELLKAYWKPLAVVLLIAGTYACGYHNRGASDAVRYAAALEKSEKAANIKYEAQTVAFNNLDAKRIADLQVAQNETDSLKSAVLAHTSRLYVHGSCAVPSIAANTGQPATANVSLDAEAQQAYFDLRDSISATEGQLTECLGLLRAERLP
jgi:outer membrane lipopolysaccharide assembly protein LptE/RlpB